MDGTHPYHKHVAPKEGHKITTMFAFIALDPVTSGEGIPAILGPDGMTIVPLVGADMARIESLRRVAKQCANETGKPVELRQFTVMKTLETINPDK